MSEMYVTGMIVISPFPYIGIWLFLEQLADKDVPVRIQPTDENRIMSSYVARGKTTG